MKLYDKIYVPTGAGKVSEMKNTVEAGNIMVVGHLAPEENVIVLTLEELKECFIYGMSSSEDTQTPNQCFNYFLESKGIILP